MIADAAPLDAAEQDGNRQATWAPVDLTEILEGTYKAPEPTVGRRDDGAMMFYPGRIHSVFAEPEAGKTWLMAIAAAVEVNQGNDVLYIDFEDTAAGIVVRLLALGVPRDDIREHFRYVHPEVGANLIGKAYLVNAVTSGTTLAVIDGVTEAMALYGLKTKEDTDVALFWRELPGYLAKLDAAPAVVLLDHVVKDRESRGRWATGSQHKLSGLNGSAFSLESVMPYGLGMTGRSRVFVVKDRPAGVRPNAVRTTSGQYWFADMVIDSKDDGSAFAHLYPPVEREETDRLQPIMEDICAVLEAADSPMSFRGIKARVTGKDDDLRSAIAALQDSKHIVVQDGPRNAQLHSLLPPPNET